MSLPQYNDAIFSGKEDFVHLNMADVGMNGTTDKCIADPTFVPPKPPQQKKKSSSGDKAPPPPQPPQPEKEKSFHIGGAGQPKAKTIPPQLQSFPTAEELRQRAVDKMMENGYGEANNIFSGVGARMQEEPPQPQQQQNNISLPKYEMNPKWFMSAETLHEREAKKMVRRGAPPPGMGGNFRGFGNEFTVDVYNHNARMSEESESEARARVKIPGLKSGVRRYINPTHACQPSVPLPVNRRANEIERLQQQYAGVGGMKSSAESSASDYLPGGGGDDSYGGGGGYGYSSGGPQHSGGSGGFRGDFQYQQSLSYQNINNNTGGPYVSPPYPNTAQQHGATLAIPGMAGAGAAGDGGYRFVRKPVQHNYGSDAQQQQAPQQPYQDPRADAIRRLQEQNSNIGSLCVGPDKRVGKAAPGSEPRRLTRKPVAAARDVFSNNVQVFQVQGGGRNGGDPIVGGAQTATEPDLVVPDFSGGGGGGGQVVQQQPPVSFAVGGGGKLFHSFGDHRLSDNAGGGIRMGAGGGHGATFPPPGHGGVGRGVQQQQRAVSGVVGYPVKTVAVGVSDAEMQRIWEVDELKMRQQQQQQQHPPHTSRVNNSNNKIVLVGGGGAGAKPQPQQPSSSSPLRRRGGGGSPRGRGSGPRQRQQPSQQPSLVQLVNKASGGSGGVDPYGCGAIEYFQQANDVQHRDAHRQVQNSTINTKVKHFSDFLKEAKAKNEQQQKQQLISDNPYYSYLKPSLLDAS